MSNRNTKVYDDLLVNASTTNEEICKDLNLPHNGNNQCVDDTKYYVNNSGPDPTEAKSELVTESSSPIFQFLYANVTGNLA